MLRCMSLLLCWFLDAGNKEARHAQLTGVEKAPRHEVAGSWAPTVQRALGGFDAAADVDDRRCAGRLRPACLYVRQVIRVDLAVGRAFGAQQCAMRALMDAAG